ncbi:MAG: integron integrase, partial [Gammaproteobacteria bacterium]|nr:integron integrase [Gammaproteobacteria bacterium]
MANSPSLFEVVRNKIRVKHYSIRTEKTYVYWIKSYLQFYSLQHPRDLGAAQIEAFLTHLAVNRNVSASTQNQALSALLFLYKVVLEIELPYLDGVTRAICRLGVRSERRVFLNRPVRTRFDIHSLRIYYRPVMILEPCRI